MKSVILNICNDPTIKKQAIKGIIKTNYPVLYNSIIAIKINGPFMLKLFCYVYEIKTNPLCIICEKPTRFISMTKGFSKTCSCKCMGMLEITKEKRKETVFKNYGVDNISKVTRDKAIYTMLNKSDIEKEKIKQQVRDTSMLKYGVDNINKLPSISIQKRRTNYNRRGVEYPTQSLDVILLREKNNLSKYGVVNPIQVPDFFEKQQHKLYAIKEYIWKTGEISKVRGYEPLVLKELEMNGYKYNDVKTSAKDMPIIWYYYKNIRHRYYPDLYIPSENLIIEVKSTYTNKCNVEINQLKYAAVKNLGFNFKLIIK